ncbi:MAG: prenyltransferase/squalene oxidase repeat-containing protein, partial [Candidatus Geothermarchaeales archaeon]
KRLKEMSDPISAPVCFGSTDLVGGETEVYAMKEVAIDGQVLDWLLGEENPSIRYFTLREILGNDEDEKRLTRTRKRINESGWVAQILDSQKEETYWESKEDCYTPKWTASVWQLIVLGDLGASGEDVRVKNACEHFLKLHNVAEGGFSGGPVGTEGPPWKTEPHVCLTGNLVRTLLRLSYGKDSRVRRAVDWLLKTQLDDGGWNCDTGHKGHSSFKSTIQPLWALSEIPKDERSTDVEEAISRATEFFLQHRLYKSSKDDSIVLLEFLRFHYPVHYSYDVLHGLRVMTSLGVTDERLGDAIQLLVSKKRSGDVWLLDGVPRGWRWPYPMHEGAYRPEESEVIERGWGNEPHTLQFEEAGKPSKIITLNALRILKNMDMLRLPREYSRS